MTKEEIIKALDELSEDDFQEEVNLRGKLISALEKEIKKEEDYSKKIILKSQLIEELDKHKLAIKKLKNTDTISIPKRLGLTIKSIADTIRNFTLKKDVVGKVKNASFSTAVCSLIAGGISVGLSALTGGVSLATFSSLVPTVSYVGLSNLIRSWFTKTGEEKVLDVLSNKEEISQKAREFAEENIINNKKFLELLKAKSTEKKPESIIVINEELIKEYKKMIDNSPNEDIKHALNMELINVMVDLKKNYADKQKRYINDEGDYSFSDYADVSKKAIALDAEIFNRENYLDEAIAHGGKRLALNTATMFFCKVLLSSVYPSLAINSVDDFVRPFIYSLISNVTSLGKYKDHIKVAKSNYTEQVIKFNNPELAKEVFSNKEKGVALAA